jgi:tetratricopeptide (TPR) repeat protein
MKAAGPLALVLAASCSSMPPAPDEVALERYARAEPLYEQGRYAEAVPHYEFCVSSRDRFKEAYYRLAYCQEQLGQEGKAVATLERLLRVDRHDEYALRHLWRLYVHRGFAPQALEAARRLEELFPSDAQLKAEVARLEKLVR